MWLKVPDVIFVLAPCLSDPTTLKVDKAAVVFTPTLPVVGSSYSFELAVSCVVLDHLAM